MVPQNWTKLLIVRVFIHVQLKTFYIKHNSVCLTLCSSVVRSLVCHPSGPDSSSESAITMGNPIMLLPSTTFLCTTCFFQLWWDVSQPPLPSVIIYYYKSCQSYDRFSKFVLLMYWGKQFTMMLVFTQAVVYNCS